MDFSKRFVALVLFAQLLVVGSLVGVIEANHYSALDRSRNQAKIIKSNQTLLTEDHRLLVKLAGK